MDKGRSPSRAAKTPGKVCPGNQQRPLFFTRWTVKGKRIRLDYDDANAAIEHKDRYDRTLVYVFLEDGTLLNLEIIRQGYGHALTRYLFLHMEELRRLGREAKERHRGLWATKDKAE